MSLVPKDRSILENSLWLRSVAPAFTAAILAAARYQTVAKGKLIYEVLDPAGGIYAVLDGLVAVRLDLGHTEVLTAHAFGPGDWFGEAAFITGTVRQVTVSALSDCSLAHVPLAALQQICDEHPLGWKWIGIQSAINTGVAARVTRNLLITDPRQRVCSVLRDLAGPAGTRLSLPLTQSDLADMCALSRSAISKILSELEKNGLCQRQYGCIEISGGLVRDT